MCVELITGYVMIAVMSQIYQWRDKYYFFVKCADFVIQLQVVFNP